MGVPPSPRLLDILLVEDSPSDRLLAMEAFARIPHVGAVHTVDNGADALAYLRQEAGYALAPHPDLVLLDLDLPKKDGRQVLFEMKSDPALRPIPVVVLSTTQEEQDVRLAYERHANGFVNKSLDFAVFVEALQAVVSYWALATRPTPRAPGAPRVAPPLPPPRSGPASRVRALLVEDDPVDAMLLRAALESAPPSRFEVVQVRRLAEIPGALAASDIDIVLTDLGLPDSVGLETYRAVRRIAPDLPVIVLTGLDDDATGEAALGEGAQDYLVKGQINASGLGRSVRHAIERHALIARLRHASRTEVVGQLAGAIAHDFNNLLTVILGNTSLLGASTDLDEVAQLATDIEDAASRAAGLVRQLLTFGRRQPMHKTPTDLNGVVGDFVRVIRRLIPGNIRIEVRLAPDLPMIVADVGMIEQVILDLTLNARDAMPGGGRLTFETALVEVAAPDAVRAGVRPGRYVRLGVQDTGVGIERELIETIWEPFYAALRPGVSSGLGLAAVRSVAQQHQGFADVHIEEAAALDGEAARRGATFSVYLPVAAASPSTPAARRGPAGASGRVVLALVPETRVLLVVDDDEARREEASDVLANAGYEIYDARGGSEARLVVARERIDLALVVVGKRGAKAALELAEALQLARRGLEVLLAAPSPGDLADLSAETRRVFLLGPWTADQLVAAIAARLPAARARS